MYAGVFVQVIVENGHRKVPNVNLIGLYVIAV